MAKIKIIFGSCGGNTELTCKEVKRLLEIKGHKVDLLQAKTSKPIDLTGSDLLIMASPTYGHGLLENFMDRLLANCYKEIETLKDQNAVVISLGNMIYDMDYLLESEKILTEFLNAKGANIIHNALLINKSPLPFLKKVIPNWVDELDIKINTNA